MDEKKNEITLATPVADLEQMLITETDPDKIEDIVQIFNLHAQKRNIIRNAKISALQDKITDQIGERVNKRADCFSNKDLLDYFKVMSDVTNKSTNVIEDIPVIQVNQQININDNKELNRASKEKVANAVKAILEKARQAEDLEEVEVVEEDEEVNESGINADN